MVSRKTTMSLRLPGLGAPPSGSWGSVAYGHDAPVVGAEGELDVHRAPVVLGLRRLGLVVEGDEGAVHDPHLRAVVVGWVEELGDQRGEPVEDAVNGRDADTEEVGELAVGAVGAPCDGGQQDAVVQQERPGSPASWRR
jgi:hypothetical protein